MSTQIDFDPKQICQSLAEHRRILTNISWSTYEQLLVGLANQSSIRLTYDKGTLEIMSPLPQHERLKHIIEMIIEILAAEIDQDVYCLASTTFKREDIERGFEPDSCFYIANENLIRGKDTIDLTIDPAPDLVIEVDITNGSLNKFPIYANLGVPELWRHNGKHLTIYHLLGADYVELNNSLAFPFIASTGISDFIQTSKYLRSTVFLKSIREWISQLQQENKGV
jgi:Uma2 family endonuclease